MLPPQLVAELEGKLSEASALVSANGLHGTGFFFDERSLLTCAHVVEGATTATVTLGSRKIDCEVADHDDVLDVALLRVSANDAFESHVCVLLDDSLPAADESIYGYGYPINPADKTRQSKDVRFTSTSKWGDIETGTTTAVELEGGAIRYGMSGGAALSLSRGAIVGLIRASHDTEKNEGGLAIPIRAVLGRFPEVQAALSTPPRIARSWIRAIGAQNLEKLGRDALGRRAISISESNLITLRVDGNNANWQVALNELPPEIAMVDVEPEDVAATVFAWAERRGSLSSIELELLGRMLFRAIIPLSLEDALATVRKACLGRTLLRLDLSDAAELRKVPWEYARARGQLPLAGDPGLAVVRLHQGPRGKEAQPNPETPARIQRNSDDVPTRMIWVMVVVSQPVAIEQGLPARNATSEWPEASKLYEELRKSMSTASNPEIRVVEDREKRLLNPSVTQFEDAMQRAKMELEIDVLHIAGFGRIGQNGVKEFAFAEEFDEEAISWQSLSELIETIGKIDPPRVVLIQQGILPATVSEPPLPLEAFLPLLDYGVMALIGANRPLHADLFRPFVSRLYESLAAGETVEMATQLSREKLTKATLGDMSLYGAFSIYTSARWRDIRLVDPRKPSETPRFLNPGVGRGC